MSELIEAAKAGDRSPSEGNPGAIVPPPAPALRAANRRSWRRSIAVIARSPTTSPTPRSPPAIRSTSLPPPPWAATSSWRARSPIPPPSAGFAYDGWTPLHLAAFFGHLDAAARLLEAGASLAAVSRNSLTNTPLHAAVAGGRVEVALFADRCAARMSTPRTRAATRRCTSPRKPDICRSWRRCCARGADPHAVDAEDQTPLSRAAARNHTAVVDLINLSQPK